MQLVLSVHDDVIVQDRKCLWEHVNVVYLEKPFWKVVLSESKEIYVILVWDSYNLEAEPMES